MVPPISQLRVRAFRVPTDAPEEGQHPGAERPESLNLLWL